jgi:hypothetical protein
VVLYRANTQEAAAEAAASAVQAAESVMTAAGEGCQHREYLNAMHVAAALAGSHPYTCCITKAGWC